MADEGKYCTSMYEYREGCCCVCCCGAASHIIFHQQQLAGCGIFHNLKGKCGRQSVADRLLPSIRGTRLYTVFSKGCGRVTISRLHLREGCAMGRNHTKKKSLQCRRFMQTPKCSMHAPRRGEHINIEIVRAAQT